MNLGNLPGGRGPMQVTYEYLAFLGPIFLMAQMGHSGVILDTPPRTLLPRLFIITSCLGYHPDLSFMCPLLSTSTYPQEQTLLVSPWSLSFLHTPTSFANCEQIVSP